MVEQLTEAAWLTERVSIFWLEVSTVSLESDWVYVET